MTAESSRGWRGLLQLRASRAQVAVAVLCGLLGFALVTQVHSNRAARGLGAARPEDLVGIIDDLSAREDRLRSEVDQLRVTSDQLRSGGAGAATALAEAQRRAQALGILAGTVPAVGPGIVVTVVDPKSAVRAPVLLDAVEELRDAGGEAIQINDVRVVAATYLIDRSGAIVVDGHTLEPPYRISVIGDPHTLSAALGIPGGLVDTVSQQPGAHASIATPDQVQVRALRGASGAG